MFIAITLVRAGLEVPVRVMNVTDQDQVLGGGTVIGHGQPAVWAANIGDQKPEPQGAEARPPTEGVNGWRQTKPEH